MKHENEPDGMAVCNFCDQAYDPEDTHTCAGNQILGRKYAKPRRVVEEEGTTLYHCAANPLITKELVDAFSEYADRLDSALDTQPGGDHYRKHAIQPVEYIVANGIGFLAGNVIKYATRYKDKGGAEDIRKIIHYAQLILEFEYKETK